MPVWNSGRYNAAEQAGSSAHMLQGQMQTTVGPRLPLGRGAGNVQADMRASDTQ